ncbi:MAG: glycosyltransferase family 2 protein, partial [Deltaproteobacteria bacterium]|nr:glycosyltransferase family 2 protein [Deltaproteobacteria bacterium]
MNADLSIIIVSYNQFSRTTGLCLHSLAAVQDIDLQIIVVDNGSDPETVQQLQEAAHKDIRIKLLLHGENRGYSAGNNDGVALAVADYILLLNSDTIVPVDVPGLMLSYLHKADVPCLVGPVTNAAGNEQQIFIRDGSALSSILAQGAEWSRNASGSVIKTDQLSFFCVAMKRETYQALGGLDELFGLGFYEDTDFCCRAAQQGIVLQVQEECFVYHQGSASFSMAGFSVKKLMSANRKQFRARHGRGDGDHVRWKNLRVLQGYLVQMQKTGISRKYLYENRLA